MLPTINETVLIKMFYEITLLQISNKFSLYNMYSKLQKMFSHLYYY